MPRGERLAGRVEGWCRCARQRFCWKLSQSQPAPGRTQLNEPSAGCDYDNFQQKSRPEPHRLSREELQRASVPLMLPHMLLSTNGGELETFPAQFSNLRAERCDVASPPDHSACAVSGQRGKSSSTFCTFSKQLKKWPSLFGEKIISLANRASAMFA